MGFGGATEDTMKWAILVVVLMLSLMAFIPASSSSLSVVPIQEKSPLPAQTPSNVSSSVQNPATSYTCYACGGNDWGLIFGGSSSNRYSNNYSICNFPTTTLLTFVIYKNFTPYFVMVCELGSYPNQNIYFYATACSNSCINGVSSVTFENVTNEITSSVDTVISSIESCNSYFLQAYPYHHFDTMILVENDASSSCNQPYGWLEYELIVQNDSSGFVLEEQNQGTVMPLTYDEPSVFVTYDPVVGEYVMITRQINNQNDMVVYDSANGVSWTNLTATSGYISSDMCDVNPMPVFDPKLGELLFIGTGYNGCNTHASDTLTYALNFTSNTFMNISASVGDGVGNTPEAVDRCLLFTLHGVVVAVAGNFNGGSTINQTWILGSKWINPPSTFYHTSNGVQEFPLQWGSSQPPRGTGYVSYYDSNWQSDYPSINHNGVLIWLGNSNNGTIASVGQWDNNAVFNSPKPTDFVVSQTKTSILVGWQNNHTETSSDRIAWGIGSVTKNFTTYSVPFSSYNITGLNSGTTYMIEVTAFDVNFASLPVFFNITTFTNSSYTALNPGTAYDLQPIVVQSNQILMGWNIPNPVNDITDSYLFWWQYGKSVNKYPCSSQCGEIVLGNDANVGNSERLLATGLSPDTTYGFWVLLTDYGVFGNYSQITYVTTENTTQPPPPPPSCSVQTLNATCIGQPYGLQLTNVSFSSASFEWNLPSTYLTNVTLWWGSECGNWSSSTSLGGVYSTTTLSKLIDNQTYCVAVMPWDGAVHGFLSNGLTFSLGRPFNLAVLAQGSTWIQISWANPYVTKIVNDTVYYGTTCGYFINGVSYGWLGNYGTGGEATAFNLTKLKSGTTYCIAVQAWDGPSNLSNPVTDTTLGVASSGGGGGAGGAGGGGVGGIGSGNSIVLPGPNVCYSLPLVGCNWWLILAGLVIVVGGVQLYRGKRYGLLLIMGGIAIAILI